LPYLPFIYAGGGGGNRTLVLPSHLVNPAVVNVGVLAVEIADL